MYELYQTQLGSRGSLAEVWINKEQKIVKKYYKIDSITIRGGKPYHNTIEEIKKLYDNEIHWSNKLKSKFTVNTLDYGDLSEGNGYFIIQEYLGPDLLSYYNPVDRLTKHIPDASKQIEEMFEFFQSHNLYKRNNAMCNLINDNGKIKAFDFKYTIARKDEYRHYEEHSVDEWISKIDPELKTILRKYL
jgi:hypothetical protein